MLAKVLKLVLSTLRDKDDCRILAGLPRRFFVVDSFDEVVHFLKKHSRRMSPCKDLRTFDFTTMYTTLPQADLCSKVSLALREAVQYTASNSRSTRGGGTANFRFFFDQSRPAQWTTATHSTSNQSVIFAPEEIVSVLNTVVTNTFAQSGGKVYHQIQGLPMGTNSAPLIANLYLYYYESARIDGLVAANSPSARDFNLFFRLIDDILIMDCPLADELFLPTSATQGMYPVAGIQLEETTVCKTRSPAVHFLGMHLSGTGDKLAVKVFDKRREFPFSVIAYPHATSNIPSSVKKGVLISQLHRFARICTAVDDFILNATYLIRQLHCRGYGVGQLLHLLSFFLRLHNPYSRPHTLISRAIRINCLLEGGELI
eukprot:GCRY01004485.1.p1 GENE.GCRY01004485.1~~GCRY01004485.1.p1  ORF type:complete len:372 (-),score=50.40 GCRY01004485.1:365-1480(-)